MSAIWKQVSFAARYWSSTVLCFSSLISELPPIATTANLRFSAIVLPHRQSHYRFLGVQAILGLIEDHRVWTIHHRAGDLDIAIGGKRMHIDGVILGKFHLLFVGDPVFVLINDLGTFIGIDRKSVV